MYYRSDQDEDESEDMTLYSKYSTPEPPSATNAIKTAPVLNFDEKLR